MDCARPVRPVLRDEAPLRLSAGGFEVGIRPEVGGSLSYFRNSAGVEILKGARRDDDAAASACFAMVPFCNRVRGRSFVWDGTEHNLEPSSRDGHQAAHGFGWRAAWDVVSSMPDSAHLRHRPAAGAWPWDYVADQRMTLDEGGLTIELSVANESSRPMPAGLGLHPYFPLTSGSRVAFSARAVEAVDPLGFPMPDPQESAILRDAAEGALDPHVGSRYIGGVSGDVRWVDRTQGLAVILRDGGCRVLALHVEEENGLFCLEPMSHAVGALNASDPVGAGVRVLSPGERFTIVTRLNVELVE